MTYRRFFYKTIMEYSKEMTKLFLAPTYMEILLAKYKGLPGPVTFSGTPAEVVQKLRRWQKGLEP